MKFFLLQICTILRKSSNKVNMMEIFSSFSLQCEGCLTVRWFGWMFLYYLFLVCLFPLRATYWFNDMSTSVLHWTAVLCPFLIQLHICCWWAKQRHCTLPNLTLLNPVLLFQRYPRVKNVALKYQGQCQLCYQPKSSIPKKYLMKEIYFKKNEQTRLSGLLLLMMNYCKVPNCHHPWMELMTGEWGWSWAFGRLGVQGWEQEAHV